MNLRQKTALLNPCRLAFETADPRFIWVLNREHRCSLVLSVNSGYE